jgi:DNA-binding transcriptional MocR family regulator
VALPVSATGWERPPIRTGLAHVTPDGQNPTGFVAGAAQRRDLLAALRPAVVAVDETFADLVLDGPEPPPMGALDPGVVTLGSMSKAFWAGLRVGWIRAEPELLSRLTQARAALDLGSPVLEQLVAARLLQHADPILAERRASLRRSRDALVAALARHLPDWRCTPPRAGMFLWVELPAPSASRLASHALDVGLRLTAGPRFTVDGTADRWLRLPFTFPAEQADAVAALLREAAGRAATGGGSEQTPARWTA